MDDTTRRKLPRPLAALLLAACTFGALWGADRAATSPGASGVEVETLRTTAGGFMLDLRYRVLDPERAALLTASDVRPVLVHERTGLRLGVPSSPKVGPLRSKKAPAGRTQFVLFRNPVRAVGPGDTVTIEMGPMRVRNLVVE